MKNITIAGGLTRDAELRRTNDGSPVLSFSVGVDDGYGDKKRSIYFECALFGKRAESLEMHLVKGTKVVVAGEFSTDEYKEKTRLTIRVSDIDPFIGGKGEPRESRSQVADRAQRPAPVEDEIPF